MDIKISSPKSKYDFDNYFNFRWKLLRKPLNEPVGTEKDDFEKESFHLMITKLDQIIAIGRLHVIDNNDFKVAQIRYMAVETKMQNKGFGSLILNKLEEYAFNHKINKIILNARLNAISFYNKNGYVIVKKSHLLYGKIKHYLMEKNINEFSL